jgi:hypothetical protein
MGLPVFPHIDGIQMSRHALLPWMAALGSTAALTVLAQTAPQASSSAGPTAQTSSAAYSSSLQDYQPFTDQEILPWKQANDTVGQIGGWRAYAKQAHDAASESQKAPAAAATPASGAAKKKGQP